MDIISGKQSYLHSVGGRLWNRSNDPSSIGIIPSPGNTNAARGMSLIAPPVSPFFAASRAIKSNRPGKIHSVSALFILDAVTVTSGESITLDCLDSAGVAIANFSQQYVFETSGSGRYYRILFNGSFIAPSDGIFHPYVIGVLSSYPASVSYSYNFRVFASP